MTDDFKISLTDLQAKAILLEHIVGEISIGYTITDDDGNDLSHIFSWSPFNSVKLNLPTGEVIDLQPHKKKKKKKKK